MSAVLDFSTRLEVHHCPTCFMPYAAPQRFFKERREDKQSFYCPSGHLASYKESESDRLRRELEEEKRNVEWYKSVAKSKDSQIKGVNIQLGKVKAKLKRTETRVGHGVCPCCNRSFVNMQRHMKTKHPDYAGDNQ